MFVYYPKTLLTKLLKPFESVESIPSSGTGPNGGL